MNRYIIDASVVVKWFIEETGSVRAEAIRVAFITREIELICPPLLPYEVLNALKYSKLFNRDELDIAAEALEHYPFTVRTIKGRSREIMVGIAVDHELSMYDAAYMALAMVEKERLITADERIEKKLPAKLKQHVALLASFTEGS